MHVFGRARLKAIRSELRRCFVFHAHKDCMYMSSFFHFVVVSVGAPCPGKNASRSELHRCSVQLFQANEGGILTP